MKNEGICTALALYDLDINYCQKAEHIKALFYYLENWMISHNWPPIRMSLKGNNIPQSTKTKTFKYYKKLLEQNGFNGIEQFWIGATPPDHSSDMFDAVLEVNIRLRQKTPAFSLYFHNDVIPHDWNYVEQLLKGISGWVKAGYGIAYQRDFNKGPGIYADGMITGPSQYMDSQDPVILKEFDNIGQWFNNYGDPEDYHHGDIRDIYPLNFLSESHLKRQVADQTLQQWIESYPAHGTLKSLTENLWSWRVPEDKISFVREALRPYGFILCI